MDNCLFCNIVNNTVPCDKLLENDSIIAFRDINPQAPTHILIIPKKHISTINDLDSADSMLVGELFLKAKEHLSKDILMKGSFKLFVGLISLLLYFKFLSSL